MERTKPSGQPGILSGVIVGAMLTFALVAISYLAWRLTGLPFVAFDLFDWISRMLPGALITSGIDAMVSAIRFLNLGSTAETAKTAEQTMAIAVAVLAGSIVGSIVFVVIRALRRERAILVGSIAGVVVGVPILIISRTTGQTGTAGPWSSGIWILIAFLIWGAAIGWAYRKMSSNQASVERLNRRQFLIKLGGATAFITLAGAVVGNLTGRRRGGEAEGELWSSNNELPNRGATLTSAPGTRPEFTPLNDHYRIDINTIPPEIREADWRLRITGLVENPSELTLAELRERYAPLDQFITLACISNPVAGDLISTQRWTGVSLQLLLPDLRLRPEATHLKIRSADDFFEIVSLETIRSDQRVMLTYAWDGVPLRTQHGFPLRIYIPDHYGMKQPKWIESIEAIDHWEPGYWVERTWDQEARMKATSVIDTVAVDMMIAHANEQTLIPIGGIAHAGARGISKVEVQVDGGEWREAALRDPLSGLTWVIWRYDWPFQSGKHTFTVRCYDGNGAAQITQEAPPHPDGASGLHSKTTML